MPKNNNNNNNNGAALDQLTSCSIGYEGDREGGGGAERRFSLQKKRKEKSEGKKSLVEEKGENEM